MNPYEAERIAAAINLLRPDWPLKQLQTLLADERITHRPRRDALVALAWVACETNSASPYRVLESGPWWRAVAVDEPTGNVAPKVDRHTACTVCGLAEPECRRRWSGDHAYASQAAQRAAIEAADLDVHRAVQGLRDVIATEPPPERHAPEPGTNGTTHVAPIREALAKESA